MRELKNIGANNINIGRRKSLTGKNKLKKVFEYYEQYRENNKLPATTIDSLFAIASFSVLLMA